MCDQLTIPLVIQRIYFQQTANIEKNAREARYAFFKSLIKDNDVLVTAHHQDDQAETFLLHLARGAGIDGLSSMALMSNFGQGKLVRPFLNYSKSQLTQYAKENALPWIEDESNMNSQFSRNFIREKVLPLLQSRWPNIIGNITQTVNHCQEARQQLEYLAQLDNPAPYTGRNLCFTDIKTLPRDRIKNILRDWFKKNKVQRPNSQVMNAIVSELIFAKQDASPLIAWSEYSLRRYQQVLYLYTVSDSESQHLDWTTFPQSIQLSSEIGHLEVKPFKEGFSLPRKEKISIKFRQGGETFYWHGQHKSLKKLMQQWKVPSWQRDKVPLIYFDDNLAIIVGYAISDNYFEKKENVYQIIQKILPNGSTIKD